MWVNRRLIVKRQKICWLIRLRIDALYLCLISFEIICGFISLFIAYFIVTTHLGIRKYHLGFIQSRKAPLFRITYHTFETTWWTYLFHQIFLKITLLLLAEIVMSSIQSHTLTEQWINFLVALLALRILQKLNGSLNLIIPIKVLTHFFLFLSGYKWA